MNLSFWTSVASIVVAFFAVIILFLTRKNILDILDKDIILFDKNFELKKVAIEKALKMADEVLEKGKSITFYSDFKNNAKQCYNELLCVATDVKIADEFYSIAIEKNSIVDAMRVAEFKLLCRRDIGLKTKHSKLTKRLSSIETEITPKTQTGNATQNVFNEFNGYNAKPETAYEFKQQNEQVKPEVFVKPQPILSSEQNNTIKPTQATTSSTKNTVKPAPAKRGRPPKKI